MDTEYGPIIIRGSSWIGRAVRELKSNRIIKKILRIAPFVSKILLNRKKTDPTKIAIDVINEKLKGSKDLF